jgi:hypothetical protein
MSKISGDNFNSDFRKTNPRLHLFYVKLACKNLSIIDRHLTELDATSLVDLSVAVRRERQKLVEEDAAYADAHEILLAISDQLEPQEFDDPQVTHE